MKKERVLIGLLISIGVFFRLFDLTNTPFGLDIDESFIWLWGKKALDKGEFWLYSPVQNWNWEMLPGYFYAIVGDYFSPRLFMSIWGLFECLLFYILLRRWTDKKKAIIAGLFFLLLPWHIYYTRLVGTCGGVLLVMFLYMLLSHRPRFALAIDIFGLCYYTTYRILFLLSSLVFFMRKKWRFLGYKIAALSGFFLLLFLSKSPLMQAVTRGSYNIKPLGVNYFFNIFYSLFISFIPPMPYYSSMSENFLEGPLHMAFVKGLGISPPGALLSFTSLLGIILFLKNKSYKSDWFGRTLLYWFLAVFICIGLLGPSYGHFLIVAPVMVYFGSDFLVKNIDKKKALAWPLCVLVFFSLIVVNVNLIFKLRDRDLMQASFHSRAVEVANYLDKNYSHLDSKNKLFSGHFVSPVIENLAYQRKTFQYYSPYIPSALVREMRRKFLGQKVVFAKTVSLDEKLYDDEKRFYGELISILRRFTVAKKVVKHGDRVSGEVYELQF